MIYTIEEIKKRIAPVAEKYKLPAVYLFGSYARGDADEKSDIDIMIDRKGTDIVGLFEWSGLFQDFSENLSKEIDMIETDIFNRSKDDRFLNNLKKDMVRIYAR